MIKTIKVKKQLNLHELIKHVWDNTLSGVYYKSDCQTFELRFDAFGRLGEVKGLLRNIEKQNTFTVEVEEAITEDMVFKTLVDVNNNDEVHTTRNVSIGLYAKEQTKEIHALINGKLELIWEAE